MLSLTSREIYFVQKTFCRNEWQKLSTAKVRMMLICSDVLSDDYFDLIRNRKICISPTQTIRDLVLWF